MFETLVAGCQKSTLFIVAVPRVSELPQARRGRLAAVSGEPGRPVDRGRDRHRLLAGFWRFGRGGHARALLESERVDHASLGLRRHPLHVLDAVPGLRAGLRGSPARARSPALGPLPASAQRERPAALFRRQLGQEEGATQIRWFLAYSGLPVLLFLAVPALLPAMRPGSSAFLRPGSSAAIVEWPWLLGMALGTVAVAFMVWTRVATRLHELWRQVTRGKIDLRQIRDLDPNRLDPHANIKNILVILIMIQLISYLDQYSIDRWLRSLFPPAFSICVLFGLVATYATYLGTRSRRTRTLVVCAFLCILALAGMLDYEVEIRNLHDLYPSAHKQLVYNLAPEGSLAGTYGAVTSLEKYQRKTVPDPTSRESHAKREQLLDRWVRSFEPSSGTLAKPGKPILVVVCSSGGAFVPASGPRPCSITSIGGSTTFIITCA